ncbi:MAG: bile acid:sodium symporter family protein [Bacteroidetes bacterium]|nr:MAG: bile acid:sodium symporter family protein [Bacteroidota bacterium]
MKDVLTDVHIDFSEGSLLFLNLALAFIMFGVALGIETKNFQELLKNPKSVITGVISQFLLLPALTFLLVFFLKPVPGLALGMILVAACPGGNVSNFFSSISKGNVALSITLTAIATILAMFMTPLNFEFYSNLYLGDKLNMDVKMDAIAMMKTVFYLLVIPLIIGIIFNTKFPKLTKTINQPIKIVSFLILIAFIVFAFLKNLELFIEYYHYIIFVVFLHNLLALGSGYGLSRLFGNKEQDNRTISIETGIQNSGLGLVLIFTIFDGNGGMALITAWWGIWHIISGIIVSLIYSKGAIFQVKNND